MRIGVERGIFDLWLVILVHLGSMHRLRTLNRTTSSSRWQLDRLGSNMTFEVVGTSIGLILKSRGITFLRNPLRVLSGISISSSVSSNPE
jgi:hypothetical protein